METRFKHVGYFNDEPDYVYLMNMSADEIIKFWKNGYGAFHESTDIIDLDCDLILEEEEDGIKKGCVQLSKDQKYVVTKDGVFIDIYKRRQKRYHLSIINHVVALPNNIDIYYTDLTLACKTLYDFVHSFDYKKEVVGRIIDDNDEDVKYEKSIF